MTPQAVLLTDVRISPADAARDFGDAQGNILKGHGRELSTFLFLEFGDAANARAWLRNLLATPVSQGGIVSTAQQLDQRAAFNTAKLTGNNADAGIFASVLFTAMGLTKLEAPLPAEAAGQVPGAEPSTAFADGMRALDRRRLADPDPRQWDAGWFEDNQPTPVHALLLLASDAPHDLTDAVDNAKTACAAANIRVRREEHGARLRADADQHDIEHFKYADGVSQPLYLNDDQGAAPPHLRDLALRADELVLLPDPLGTEPNSWGSFMVFRKLQQDVAAFKNEEKALGGPRAAGTPNGLNLDDAERAGAMLVGRFENGTPVALRANDGAGAGGRLFTNDFTYGNDPSGARCPFHAHIRKMNPRGETGDPAEIRHRITRRGVPYGEVPKDETEPDGQERGLLFVCYQRNISQQFEFLQQSWANNPGFLFGHGTVGLDPIIGQPDLHGRNRLTFPTEWLPAPNDSATTLTADFGQHVQLKGGEYFYAPSLSGLAALAGNAL